MRSPGRMHDVKRTSGSILVTDWGPLPRKKK
jgi:hypothetical protein